MKIELLGKASKKELEERIKRVASAGKLSRFPGSVFEVIDSCDDYEKNLKLVKRIINMGHKSIIEHDYLVFALSDVSPIIEQTIIGNRLTSFTIKSRREVDFSKVGYYTPKFRGLDLEVHTDNDLLTSEYKEHMDYLFNEYSKLVEKEIPVEDARFILPYSYHSNIIMGCDAREFEKITVSLLKSKLSNIQELKELGEKFFEIIKKDVPYLEETVSKEVVDTSDRFSYLGTSDYKLLKKPILIDYTENADEKVLIHLLMQRLQITKEEALVKLEKIDKKKLMKDILNSPENRELEYVNYVFQIPISLAVLTHLTRHRMHPLLVPDFVPMWNLDYYQTPSTIKDVCLAEYNNIYKKNKEICDKFRTAGVCEEDLVYFYLSGQMVNVTTNFNGRTLSWISRMRACNKAQWEIRNLVKDMVNQVKKVSPLVGTCLGPSCVIFGECPEGQESCKLKTKEGK